MSNIDVQSSAMTALMKNSAKGAPVLYLDFDGVLHPDEVYKTRRHGVVLRAEGHTLFENVPLLVQALAPYPALKIVLSTSWVVERGFQRAKAKLGADLGARVLGATFHNGLMDDRDFSQLSRGQQIAADAARRGHGGWIALDDDDEHWPAQHRNKLVRCNPDNALAESETFEALQRKLQELHCTKI